MDGIFLVTVVLILAGNFIFSLSQRNERPTGWLALVLVVYLPFSDLGDPDMTEPFDGDGYIDSTTYWRGRILESSIVEAVQAAEVLIDEGDQGDAQSLLTRTLTGCCPARGEEEAMAIVQGTGLLIGLDAGIFSGEVLSAHVERMHYLTAGFDGADVTAARVEAELGRFEWVHSHDDVDPIVLVDVLRAATEFSGREQGSADERVRRAAAEAALTAHTIREWLNQDASSIAVALESLALGLAEETDMRIRHIRVVALHRAARLRTANDSDAEGARYLLRLVISEAAECPPARSLYYSATLRLADLAIDAGVTPGQALIEATIALHSKAVAGVEEVQDAWLRCGHLEQLLERYPVEERVPVALAEWIRLVDRYGQSHDARVRATILDHVRLRCPSVKETTAVDLQILQYAQAATLDDTDPETAEARFRVAAQLVEIHGYPDSGTVSAGAPRRDPATAVRLSEDLEQRFPDAATHPELSALMARLVVERALRISDTGRSEDALLVLSGVRSKFASAPARKVRHIFAQADYWQGRLYREAGNRTKANIAIDAVVKEFSRDPDADVRVWAANALFSAWRDPALDATDADLIFVRFAEIFSNDVDPRIRRHEAAGRLSQAVRAHEQGSISKAIKVLGDLIETFAEDTDADTADTVRLARENLTVLSLSAGNGENTGSEERYRDLRGRLYAADKLHESGMSEEAAREWRAIVEATAGTQDPNIAVLGLAALDMWGGYLNDTRKWLELIDVTQRAMVTRGRLDFRAERIRARAYLRFGIAQGSAGDPRSAIAAYEALDALVADVTDDEVRTTRQQAVYNRAVLIDDIGDTEAAINAYDHVLAVHSASSDSQARRLRRVKALRNKAQLLEGMNRIAEAASAHRQIIDTAAGNPAPDLNSRARPSAFSLAECYTRLDDHASAAHTYAWIRSHPPLGFTKAEIRSAASAQKAAERQSRRMRRN